ncbi:UNVERIFIED_CONTAM: hypothetical protein GTU68_018492 [Idotea baltica]|nr:hypothetical protein [Idotea baltica]
MQMGGGDWGIRALSLRSAQIRDALASQDYTYTAVTMGPDGEIHQVIEVIEDVLVVPEDPTAAIAALADPSTKIVSMTITEKGYCHNPADGQLRLDDPDIAHDLAHPDTPRTAPGLIVYALAARRAAGNLPFTVLSCDNLPQNGTLTRQIILNFAKAVDPELAEWIATHGRFPTTMVDRITPATTPADIDRLAEDTGYSDPASVFHEPFKQWVIEDNFVEDARPDWDAAGAQFVADVTPFEMMKLRCLNGTHSALAYLGYLAGFETVAEAMNDKTLATFIDHLWRDEIIPSFAPPQDTDLTAYCAALKTRYQNPNIQHRTWQIAMDGSQKLPQRILGTISDNLAAGRPITGLTRVVAAWMIYVGGTRLDGSPIDVRDPLADLLRDISNSHLDAVAKVTGFLNVGDVFNPDLAAHPQFREAVLTAYQHLTKRGILPTLSHACSNPT